MLKRLMLLGALAVLSLTGAALAMTPIPPHCPEIDPGVATGAIALLAGCVAILRARITR